MKRLIRVLLQTPESPTSLSLIAFGLFAVLLSSVTSVYSQGKQRLVHWPEIPMTDRHVTSSNYYSVLAEIDVLEISDVTVSGKSITLGEGFAADDEWLKNLTVRVKNVSNINITSVQLNFFLPEIMPGGPLVTLCYGCGDVGKGEILAPGEEVEMRIVFYSWLLGQINAKSSLSNITSAEVQNMIVTTPEGKRLFSGCVRTTSVKNACPKP